MEKEFLDQLSLHSVDMALWCGVAGCVQPCTEINGSDIDLHAAALTGIVCSDNGLHTNLHLGIVDPET